MEGLGHVVEVLPAGLRCGFVFLSCTDPFVSGFLMGFYGTSKVLFKVRKDSLWLRGFVHRLRVRVSSLVYGVGSEGFTVEVPGPSQTASFEHLGRVKGNVNHSSVNPPALLKVSIISMLVATVKPLTKACHQSEAYKTAETALMDPQKRVCKPLPDMQHYKKVFYKP